MSGKYSNNMGAKMKIETTAEQMLFATIKIETFHPGGSSSGTGFYFKSSYGDNEFPCIVTNKHVVEGGKGGRLIFTKEGENGQPAIGNGFTLDISPQEWIHMWYGHPDPAIDIAITPMAPIIRYLQNNHGIRPYFSVVDSSIIPTEEQLSQLNVMESVTFVGYPNGLWDTKNLIPIMRKGTTATPIALDFEGEPKFLIDASVFGGSSGSPVFVLDHGLHVLRDGSARVGSRLYFLGVIAAVYQRTDHNAVIPIPIPSQFQAGVTVNQMIDLGIVFKARTVVETIESFVKLNPPGV